jgi:hypothetical protein
VNYWRDNIPLLSALTAPLDKLRGVKDLTDVWTTEADKAYHRIIEIRKKGTYLHHADFEHPFYGASDASGTGIGGCVYQIIEGETRYIVFYSRSLSKSERNYSATKRELLGMIWTIKKGHSYFWGRHFTFYTDHAALTYYQTQKQLNAMLVGWLDSLLVYNFTIIHKPGILNILPDALSRLYPAKNLAYCQTGHKEEVSVRTAQIEEIIDLTGKEEEDKIPSFIGPRLPPDKEMVNEDTVTGEEEQKELILKAHLVGHFGADAIVHHLHNDGHKWKYMRKQALQCVSACPKCQKYNIQRHGFRPETKSIVAELPGDHYAIDLAGLMPTTERGNNFLFVCIDICDS